MLSQATYALEHFYYGQLFYQGKPQGDLRLLASSPGVKNEHVNEAAQDSSIPPVPGNPTGSWALLRGQTISFMLIQSQVGNHGQAVRHIVLMPVDVLRSLGGNLKALSKLIEVQMPIFEQVGATIPLLQLSQAGVPDAETQEADMLGLMGATHDRLDVIEALLAAIIQGVPIVVKGAPTELAQRVGFIQGLLALLPPPARFGVTFATHTLPSTHVDAQIRFLTDDPPPPNTLVYLWDSSHVEGRIVEDEFARFIRSQLRLDTHLVIDQTTALTGVAAWRIKRGDTLAEALKYASYRLKLDTGIMNNQPVDAGETAKVLAEDPTLSDPLRTAYVRHLLAFALVLDEIEHADKLAVVVRGQPELERVILEQMSDALAAGKAERVYRTLARWLSNPLGFNGMYWVELTQRAALAYAEGMAKSEQIDGLNGFLRHVRRNSGNIEIAPIIPRLIEISLPLAVKHQTLAENVFVLAAGSLPANRWQRFIAIKPLLAKLAPSLTELINTLGNAQAPARAGLLAQVAAEFGEDWQPLLIIRLSEVALLVGRRDLIDTAALSGLVKATQSAFGGPYDPLLRWIVRNLSDDESLLHFGLIGSRYLLQILLARGAYEELGIELIHQGRLLYPSDKQLNYAAMVRSLFVETPIPVAGVPEALKFLNAKGLKPLPLAMAYFGALEQHHWTNVIESVAAELTTLVFSNRLITEAIQLDLIMELLQYHVQRHDSNYTIRVATLVPAAAVRRSENGLPPLIQMYRALNWDDEVRAAAMEALRRFIRRCSDSFAQVAVDRFRNELGDEIGAALEATYALRRLTGGEDLADYAYSIHTVAQFLYDTGLAYADKNTLPLLTTLLGDLDSLNGGLNDEERKAAATAILEMMRLVATLCEAHRKVHSRENDDQIAMLLRGEGDAQTVFDIFRVMGGYFARGKRLTSRTDRIVVNHPLGDRSAPIMLRETQQITRLLKAAQRAFLVDAEVSVDAHAIYGEMESLWSDIALYERRNLVRDLAIDLERIPELALMITDKTDTRSLIENSGLARRMDSNRQRPETTFQLYRFMYGYFSTRLRH